MIILRGTRVYCCVFILSLLLLYIIIHLQMIGTPRVGRELMVSVEFMNPYNFTLQKVQLRLDGPGLIPTKLKEYR